jgi:hypothetical protein
MGAFLSCIVLKIVLGCLNKEIKKRGMSMIHNMNGRYKCIKIFGEDNCKKNLKIHGIVRKWIPIIEVRIGFRSYEYSS